MADAFGEAGKALGDLASSFAGYMADQDHLKSVRDEQLRQAALMEKTEERAQRERQINSLFAARSLTSQIGLYGDMTHAAQGFFKEGSSGYQALETAEKAFRAVEFALAVRAMAQAAIEPASSLAARKRVVSEKNVSVRVNP